MMAKKSNNPNSILLAILMLILGAAGAYYIKSDGGKEKLTNEFSRVEKINGLYVFIESSPVNEYESLHSYKGEDLASIYNSLGIGEQKAGQVMMNILNAANQNLVFSEVLNKMTASVSQSYKDASGVIFRNKLKECEVIKFK